MDAINKNIMEYIILIIVLTILLVFYFIYIIKDERKKMQYYKTSIYYESNWDKYSDMLKKQKKIILYKKIQLLFLNVLVFLKELFVWK